MKLCDFFDFLENFGAAARLGWAGAPPQQARLRNHFTVRLAAVACACDAAGGHVAAVLCGTYDGMLASTDVEFL